MRAKKILDLADGFKRQWNTNDPYEIAERLGITVLFRDTCPKDFTAQTLRAYSYPPVISINDAYTESSKRLLCAHELGHALLHENCVNYFATTKSNVLQDVEREANLFALALLLDDETRASLTVPLCQMSNYLLRSIMEKNLKKSE